MKQPKKGGATFFTESRTVRNDSKRHEIDALIQGIISHLNQKPKKVIKVLELWVNNPKSRTKVTTKRKAS